LEKNSNTVSSLIHLTKQSHKKSKTGIQILAGFKLIWKSNLHLKKHNQQARGGKLDILTQDVSNTGTENLALNLSKKNPHKIQGNS